MCLEGFNEGFELSDDCLTRITGWNIVNAAHQDQVEWTRDLVLVLKNETGMAVVNAATLKIPNKASLKQTRK
jgi:hypothetical protein